MEIWSNLKQIAIAKGKNWRTIKRSIKEYEEVWRTNKYWKRELVGYIDDQQVLLYKQNLDGDSQISVTGSD